jgi:CRP-like cAMP-binding protein
MDLSEFLRTSPAFEGFTQPDIEVLELALRVDRFPADHTLLSEGTKGNVLYILMEGEVRVTHKHASGRGVDELGVLVPGDVFGLQSLIDGRPRYSTCRTMTPAVAASLPGPAFELLYNQHTELAEHFQYLVARQLVRDLRRLDRGIVKAVHGGEVEPLHQLL